MTKYAIRAKNGDEYTRGGRTFSSAFVTVLDESEMTSELFAESALYVDAIPDKIAEVEGATDLSPVVAKSPAKKKVK